MPETVCAAAPRGAQCHSAMTEALASDASHRNMVRQATRITFLMRHGANLLVCAVVVAIPPVSHEHTTRAFALALGLWSACRLGTRSQARSTSNDQNLWMSLGRAA